MNSRLNNVLCRGNFGTTYNTSYLKHSAVDEKKGQH